MTGMTYNGKDDDGNALWDSCANIRIRNYEKASTCQELILAFNINTNRWMAKWVLAFCVCRLINNNNNNNYDNVYGAVIMT